MDRNNRDSELVAPCDADLEYVAFDLETTGLETQRDRVVEIAQSDFAERGR